MDNVALLSVSDRTGLLEFARGLVELGFRLLTTSGTGEHLSAHSIESVSIEQYTGQKEILGGRVKTLHPRIYAGLLARLDNPQDLEQLASQNISPIQVAAVNLYPFGKHSFGKHSFGQHSSGKHDGADKGHAAKSFSEMIELIDVGGPSMIRAAAKNHRFVLPVIDPSDYGLVLQFLRGKGQHVSAEEESAFRGTLAQKVFAFLAQDNLNIGEYLSDQTLPAANPEDKTFAPITGAVLRKKQSLRYGENPHQAGAFYLPYAQSICHWEQLGGRELSYNNLLDLDATIRLLSALKESDSVAVIIKHLNPCGAAYGASLLEALQKAKRGDPRSHFGGILGFGAAVGEEVAHAVREDFAEIVVAPAYSEQALAVLRTSKNLRIIRANPEDFNGVYEYRTALDGVLIQNPDRRTSSVTEEVVVSQRKPEQEELHNLQFAWSVCSYVRSNAIVLVRDAMVIGVGAGQMSRVDSVELAISKARTHGHEVRGTVAASDAFFPFADGIETLAQAGVRAVIAPRGAKRDAEIIAAADAFGISLLFTEDRHFRH